MPDAPSHSGGATMNKGTLTAAAALVALTAVSVSNAQEERRLPGGLNKPVAAPSNALEVDVGTGYHQGFGGITNRPSDRVQDYSGAGIALGLDIGYRVNPHFSI